MLVEIGGFIPPGPGVYTKRMYLDLFRPGGIRGMGENERGGGIAQTLRYYCIYFWQPFSEISVARVCGWLALEALLQRNVLHSTPTSVVQDPNSRGR